MAFIDNLRIIILECPYDTWGDPLTRDLFSKLVHLKIAGYQQEYEYGVLPVDTTDFIATHQLVCRETPEGFIPLTGYKSTTLERVKKHGLTFPGLGLVRSAQAQKHEKAVTQIIERCERENKSLAYTSTWTMDPSVKNNRELRMKLRDIFEAMYVLFHLEQQISEILVGGTLRFKTEALFEFWGHHFLQLGREILPPIYVPHLLDEKVVVMHLKKFSEAAIKKVEPFRFMWNQKMTIAAPSQIIKSGSGVKIA
jgi:hypothetical protein